MSKLNFLQQIGVRLIRPRVIADVLDLRGRFPRVEHIRNGQLIGLYDFPNGITNEGKNFMFDCLFNATTQVSAAAWSIGLIGITGYSALAAGDTMASHGGWTEFTGYSQSTRVAWGQGAASSQSITNGTAATFDITASTDTLKGIFVTSVNTKSGTTGKLWTTGLFNADVPVVSGDQIKLTYAVAA